MRCNLKSKILLVGVVVLTGYGFQSMPAWKNISRGLNQDKITYIASFPGNPDMLVVASDRALFVSDDAGKTFRRLSLLAPEMINYVYISAERGGQGTGGKVFAVTPQTVLMSEDGFDHWEKIFSSGNPQRQQNINLAESGARIWIGTTDGLYIKEKDGGTREYGGAFRNKVINHLKVYKDGVLASAGNEVYAARPDGEARKVFEVFAAPRELESEVETSEDETVPVSLGVIRDIEVSARGSVYIVTTKGIFYQSGELDQKEWKTIPLNGLSGESITDMSVDDAGQIPWIFVATDNGVFYTIGHGFKPLYRGFYDNQVSRLHMTEDALYAATESGLFYLPVEEAFSGFASSQAQSPAVPSISPAMNYRDYRQFVSRFGEEPDIREVQKMAVRYADVDKSKIDSWKKLARIKAIVPSVGVDLNRSDSDLYHWDTGQSPDVLQRGTDYTDWDVSLSWDLSEMVWSSDMTSIDSRSKLMVELREDILDEITRLYFERRRTQMELVEQLFSTRQEYLEKQMRVDELTALIDALTGGEFSARIQESRTERGDVPEEYASPDNI